MESMRLLRAGERVAPRAATVLRWTGPLAGHARRGAIPRVGRANGQEFDAVLPAVAEVVRVAEGRTDLRQHLAQRHGLRIMDIEPAPVRVDLGVVRRKADPWGCKTPSAQ